MVNAGSESRKVDSAFVATIVARQFGARRWLELDFNVMAHYENGCIIH
jgi:hypothetical protein